MNQVLDFSIPRGRLVLLSSSFAVGILLLYSAGILTGIMFGPAWLKTTRPELASNPLRAAKTNHSAPISAPIGREPKLAATPIAVKPIPNKDFGPVPAQLAIQVASFTDRIRAQSFADSLKRQGFPALAVGAVKSGEQTWYSVRLGPYTDWDTASRAAAEVQRSYDVQTFVRPL